jgi:hypothetical protein
MYNVNWREEAVQEIVRVWDNASSELRAAIEQAVESVNETLQQDATVGESRTEGLRIWFVPPLGLIFELEEGEGVVRVQHAWVVRPRRK